MGDDFVRARVCVSSRHDANNAHEKSVNVGTVLVGMRTFHIVSYRYVSENLRRCNCIKIATKANDDVHESPFGCQHVAWVH